MLSNFEFGITPLMRPNKTTFLFSKIKGFLLIHFGGFLEALSKFHFLFMVIL